MLDLKGSNIGEFDFYTRRISEEEKKFYGIFISHSSKDNEKYLYPLRDAMIKAGLYPLCDRDFLSGGDEYQKEIEKALDCYAAVIILTPASLLSDWVNYEIGFLSGRGKQIFIWDAEGIFSPKSRDENNIYNELYNNHFKKIGVVYNTLDELLAVLSKATPYAEMFSEENDFLSAEEFYARVSDRVESVMATIESEIFDEHYAEFKNCKFGVLIPNFGMFYSGHGDGAHCYAKRSAEITDGICPINNKKCALCGSSQVDGENKECVILNYLAYTGILRRKNEINRRGERVECGCVEFCVPFHKYFGTELKFILDVDNDDLYNRVMQILDNAGMNPTSTDSKIGGRIYLSLPERRGQGLFRLQHEFTNNFLCPYVMR